MMHEKPRETHSDPKVRLLVTNRDKTAEFWTTVVCWPTFVYLCQAVCPRLDINKWHSNDEGAHGCSAADCLILVSKLQEFVETLEGDTYYPLATAECLGHCTDSKGHVLTREQAEDRLKSGGDVMPDGTITKEQLQDFIEFLRISGGFGI